jgi:hypothetical protein
VVRDDILVRDGITAGLSTLDDVVGALDDHNRQAGVPPPAADATTSTGSMVGSKTTAKGDAPFQRAIQQKFRLVDAYLNELGGKSLGYLLQRYQKLAARVRDGEPIDSVSAECIAIGCAVVFKQNGYRPYKGQIEAALVVVEGHVARAGAGLGKTTSQILADIVFALDSRNAHGLPVRGRGVLHAVTDANMARAHEKELRLIAEPLGLSVARLADGEPLAATAGAFQADILVATASQVTFKQLLQQANPKLRVTGGRLGRATIDEVDAIAADLREVAHIHSAGTGVRIADADLAIAQWIGRRLTETTRDKPGDFNPATGELSEVGRARVGALIMDLRKLAAKKGLRLSDIWLGAETPPVRALATPPTSMRMVNNAVIARIKELDGHHHR